MKKQAVIRLFKDLFDGDPWLEVNIMATLKGIDSKRAMVRIAPGRNTIWEIVNHIIGWRNNILQRLQGEVIPSPADNYIAPVEDESEVSWHHTLDRMKASQEQWVNFLKEMESENAYKVEPGGRYSSYEFIHGILQHDAYHLGQIVLLSKLV